MSQTGLLSGKMNSRTGAKEVAGWIFPSGDSMLLDCISYPMQLHPQK